MNALSIMQFALITIFFKEDCTKAQTKHEPPVSITQLPPSYGYESVTGQFPFVIYIHYKWTVVNRGLNITTNQDTCTGSIVGRHWVLTAARCVPPLVLFTLLEKDNARVNGAAACNVVYRFYAGLDGDVANQTIVGLYPESLDIHPYEDAVRKRDALSDDERPAGENYDVDVVLFRFKVGEFTYNEKVRYVPMMNPWPLNPKAFVKCTTVGFGEGGEGNRPGRMYYSNKVKAGGKERCNEAGFKTKCACEVCVKGEDVVGVCEADKGGPLVCTKALEPRVYVVGVLSTTFSSSGRGGAMPCATSDGVFGRYVATGYVRRWVLEVVDKDVVEFVGYEVITRKPGMTRGHGNMKKTRMPKRKKYKGSKSSPVVDVNVWRVCVYASVSTFFLRFTL